MRGRVVARASTGDGPPRRATEATSSPPCTAAQDAPPANRPVTKTLHKFMAVVGPCSSPRPCPRSYLLRRIEASRLRRRQLVRSLRYLQTYATTSRGTVGILPRLPLPGPGAVPSDNGCQSLLWPRTRVPVSAAPGRAVAIARRQSCSNVPAAVRPKVRRTSPPGLRPSSRTCFGTIEATAEALMARPANLKSSF